MKKRSTESTVLLRFTVTALGSGAITERTRAGPMHKTLFIFWQIYSLYHYLRLSFIHRSLIVQLAWVFKPRYYNDN